MLRIRNLLVFTVLLLLPGLVSAQSSALDRILKTGELRVGTSGGQPPFTAMAKDGELMGFDIELAHLLADAMGVKVRFVEKSFSDLLPALEKREVDVVISGLTITPERNIKATFAGPYILSGKSILAKPKRLAAIDEVGKINRSAIRVVALKGSTSQRFVERLAPKAKLITAPDYRAAVKMVLDDRVDLMVADYPICVLSLLRHPNAGLATLDEPLTIEPIGIALPRNDFVLHNLIENYLGALQMAGVLTDLEEEWFQDGNWLIRLP